MVVLAIVEAGFGYVLLDVILSLLMPSLDKENVGKYTELTFHPKEWTFSVYTTYLRTHYLRIAYSGMFLDGTIIRNWIEILCGATMHKPFEVVLFGKVYDNKFITINSQEDSYFVTDIGSNFSSHLVHMGQMIIKKTESYGSCSIHSGAYCVGQSIFDITLASNSRIFFLDYVNLNRSGVFNGVPARECRDDRKQSSKKNLSS
jgi:hypothetical protein